MAWYGVTNKPWAPRFNPDPGAGGPWGQMGWGMGLAPGTGGGGGFGAGMNRQLNHPRFGSDMGMGMGGDGGRGGDFAATSPYSFGGMGPGGFGAGGGIAGGPMAPPPGAQQDFSGASWIYPQQFPNIAPNMSFGGGPGVAGGPMGFPRAMGGAIHPLAMAGWPLGTARFGADLRGGMDGRGLDALRPDMDRGLRPRPPITPRPGEGERPDWMGRDPDRTPRDRDRDRTPHPRPGGGWGGRAGPPGPPTPKPPAKRGGWTRR